MKKKSSILSTIIFLTLTILVSVSSCKSEQKKEIDPEFARYISAFTFGNIYSTSEIQVELAQDMPNVEVGAEISDELFRFSPSIEGKAYWLSTRSIKFVPEEGELQSGKTYDAWFNLGKVLKVDKAFEKFYFYFWIPEQNYAISLKPFSPMKDNDLAWNTVQGTLTLADEAKIDKIEKMFSLSGDNAKKAIIRISPTIDKAKYAITIDSLYREKEGSEYTLNINRDAIGAKENDIESLTISLPPTDGSHFEVVDASLDDTQSAVEIAFSHPLALDQNIQGLIQMTGVDRYTYDIKANILKIYFDRFKSSSNITLDLFKELKNNQKKNLDKNYKYNFSIEQNKPEIELLNSGYILPDSENLIVPFRAVGLWAVDVKIIKIFENNILGYMQANDWGESGEIKRFGRLIMKKQIRLDEDPTLRLNEWNNFSLDLSKLMKQDPGAIYRVDFSMSQEYSLYPCDGVIPQRPTTTSIDHFNTLTEEDEAKWDNPGYYYYDDTDWYNYNWEEREDPCKPTYYMNKTQSNIVFASNIGVVAKMGSEKKVEVALADIISTKPISGAEVTIYNYQMQRIGSGKTDGDGFCTLEYKSSIPYILVAANGKDKAYMKLTSNLSLSMSNFDISGRELQKGMKGYIYGERGVWRPGDTIFVTFILEDRNHTLPTNHPVSLDFYNPRGQMQQRYTSTNGENGFYTFKLKTGQDDITGDWQARINVGGATFYKTLKVETVKPNRLKVRLGVDEIIDAGKGSFTGTISSQWLHGAAASNLKAQVEMKLSSVYRPFATYQKYAFSNPLSNFYSDTYTIFDGRLDAEGNADIRADLPQAAGAPGMLRASFVSQVFETGGDASINTQTTLYSPFEAYVGVAAPVESDYEWMETDKDNILDIITLSPEGKPVNRKNMSVKIYKLRWSWWWSSNDESLSSYVNSTSAEVLLDEKISTANGGKAQVKFRVDYPDWGRYLVVVKDEDGGHTSGRMLYIDWPSWRGRSDKGGTDGPTMLSFSTDKQSYEVGEKVTVILPQSSSGRALISIEDGTRVLSKDWVKVSDKEDTKYTFTVTDEMLPNFYIFATLLQPHAQTDNDSPIRMYGVLNISATSKETELKPVINMPDELRPEKEFTVSISEQNKKDMTYTLAVVDDGLLDLTNFKTPNAWPEFYSRQALGVRTWDIYDLVVGAQTGKFGPLLSIGGDEALNPAQESSNRFKPVVKFLGPFTLKGGKTNTHKIMMPPYVGSVRTMVVAGNQNGAYGNAEKTTQVKNPLMILSTLPRVAGPGEEILLPVNVFAMDKKVKDVSVKVESKGLFQFTDGTSKSVSFSETGDKMVYFKVKVPNKIGHETVTIKATGGGEAATETIEIEIRNPNPPVLVSSQAMVKAKGVHTLDIAMDSPQAEDWVKLEVSRMPGIDFNKNMSFLRNYPHGCSEQVTSQTFPLLYISNFVEYTDKEKNVIDNNIKEGIKIICARQLGDGGIVYWPGNSYPTEWVTTYAGHFLVEAKRAGWDVPTSVIDRWKKFQKKASQSWNKRDLYNSYYEHSMSDLQQAYRLYTLALVGEPELGAMNRLKEMKEISNQARWRLAAAYLIAGKTDAANQLLRSATETVDRYSFNNNTYGSSARDEAMIMETYLLMDQTDKALKLSFNVAESLNSDYVTTQTAAFGLIAMSKLAEKMGKGAISYEWELNGVKQSPVNSGKPYSELDIKPQEKVNVKFTNNSGGELYVRLIGRSKPIASTVPPIKGNVNLYVTYENESGQEIKVSSLPQGTEFYAKVVVQNVSGQSLTDLALTNIFASGWEIFNTRLYGGGSATGGYNYQDIRDDRVLTYFNLGAGYSQTFRIKLQAAYCGRFYLPAVSCEAMYNPEEQSRTSGQWVEVKQGK